MENTEVKQMYKCTMFNVLANYLHEEVYNTHVLRTTISISISLL